jgi:hypothetical protein
MIIWSSCRAANSSNVPVRDRMRWSPVSPGSIVLADPPPTTLMAARSSRLGRVSRPLQARAKRNVIVHAATSAPRWLIVNRAFHPHHLSSARSSPVVRPNARAHEVRCRAADASIMPTSASRPHLSRPALSRAAGRCTVRRQHRMRRDERPLHLLHARGRCRSARSSSKEKPRCS